MKEACREIGKQRAAHRAKIGAPSRKVRRMSTTTSTQSDTITVLGKGGPNLREVLDGFLFSPDGYLVEFTIDTPGRAGPKKVVSGRVIGVERETEEVNYRQAIRRHVTVKMIVHSSPAQFFFPGDIISNWYEPITRKSRMTVFEKMF